MRLAGALLVLVVPTALMGATLPLVAASRLVRHRRPASRVCAVYAANTAGAIAGAVVTGFVLICGIGIHRAFWVAASCNVFAALLAWWRAGVESRAGGPDSVPDVHAASPAPALTPAGSALPETGRTAVLIVLGLSGLAALALEIVWFRILVLFVPATTYAFTTMLAAVLGGIATGSWIAARLLRRERDWLHLLTVIQAMTAPVILLSLVALAWTYGRGWRTSGLIQASVLATFPATVLMGLPFRSACGSGSGRRPPDTERRVRASRARSAPHMR